MTDYTDIEDFDDDSDQWFSYVGWQSEEEYKTEQEQLLAGALVQIGLTEDVGVAGILSHTLFDAGVRVDGEALSDYAALEQAAEKILKEEGDDLWGTLVVDVGEGSLYGEVPPALTAEVLEAAHQERVDRLQYLARESAASLIPRPEMHAEMDRLLDEVRAA